MPEKLKMTEIAQTKGIANLSEEEHLRLFEETIGLKKGLLDPFGSLWEVFKADLPDLEKVIGNESASDVYAITCVDWNQMKMDMSLPGIEETLGNYRTENSMGLGNSNKRTINEGISLGQ